MLGARGRLFSVDGFINGSSGELGVGAFAEFPRLRMQSWKEFSREILKMAPIVMAVHIVALSCYIVMLRWHSPLTTSMMRIFKFI
jgi:hypothetical protein